MTLPFYFHIVNEQHRALPAGFLCSVLGGQPLEDLFQCFGLAGRPDNGPLIEVAVECAARDAQGLGHFLTRAVISGQLLVDLEELFGEHSLIEAG